MKTNNPPISTPWTLPASTFTPTPLATGRTTPKPAEGWTGPAADAVARYDALIGQTLRTAEALAAGAISLRFAAHPLRSLFETNGQVAAGGSKLSGKHNFKSIRPAPDGSKPGRSVMESAGSTGRATLRSSPLFPADGSQPTSADAPAICHIAAGVLRELRANRGDPGGSASDDRPGHGEPRCDVFHQLLAQPPGAFTRLAVGENPEPWWYNELLLLHVVSSFAFEVNDPAVWPLVRDRAAHHHANTQPDHATTEPWAVHAFVLDPDFFYTADQMLHALAIQQAQAHNPIALLALRDALYCLRK